MDIFLKILSAIWQIISKIICYILSVLVFCFTKLKELLQPNEVKTPQPEYPTKQDLFAWLDDYFKNKTVEKPLPKTATSSEYSPIETVSTYETEMSSHNTGYALPLLDLLKDYPQGNNKNIAEEIEHKRQLIKQTLGDFGIGITEITATIGATVTLYELVPARGVAIDKITNKDTEIAIALKVEAVRIIAPFKNRGTVAIEAPNENRSIVGIKSLLQTETFANCCYELPLVLGKTIDGEVKIIDLTQMPHILVAGASGKGKSVGLNAMLTSLLYKKRPDELQFMLFDPKRQELDIYKTLKRQFLVKIPDVQSAVIIDDKDEITTALNWLKDEVSNRNKLLAENDYCKTLKEYNVKANKKLPYIVIMIDEFPDIQQSKEIEQLLISLSRKARSVGIHFIIATQRPSAKTITREISSNFTAQIAFKVSKHIDSQIILDNGGAEKLVGNGDLLFLFNSEMERLQGAFVSADEVKNIVNFVAEQNYKTKNG
jgi:S-DNA-T family DNA segregation ATPase FtsK/SpoIIIE